MAAKTKIGSTRRENKDITKLTLYITKNKRFERKLASVLERCIIFGGLEV